MIDMAVPQPEDDPSMRRGRFKNRQVSVYASRIKPSVTPLNLGPGPTDSPPEKIPELPPLPVSPRWDSLSHGPHILHTTVPEAHPPIPSQDAWPQPSSIEPVEAFPQIQPLDAAVASIANDVSSRALDSSRDLPSHPLTTKSSLTDIRSPDPGAVENFSRPRKQSIKQPIVEPIKTWVGAAPPPSATQDTTTSVPQTPPWPHSRRPSVSSFKSSSTFASPMPVVPGEVTSPKLPITRNTNGTAISSTRPVFSGARAESSTSVPLVGGTIPWVAGDEVRSSFRSQLTTSTGPGTAATERSSVLTKDSSVSSVYAHPDEPSLEDLMRMYEKGFADDSDTSDSEDHRNSRPVTAMSEPGPRLEVAENPTIDRSVPPVPAGPALLTPTDSGASDTQRSLEAEIRRSKMIFTSPDFTSSVPAISNNLDIVETIKRDSARSLTSEQSAVSDPTAHTTSQPSPETATSPSPPPPVFPSLAPSISATASLPQPEPEDPGSRDRYGFKKQSPAITRQEYDAWNKEYSMYLARRRRKWVAYLKDCALMTDRPIRFPAPNSKTKRFVRKGIPPDWRGAAWFYYAGGPAILAKHAGLYEKLLYKKAKQIDAEAIERDLHRTFPDNIQFKPSETFLTAPNSERTSQSTMTDSTASDDTPGPRGVDGEPPIITSLRRVLHAFSVYNPQIGYCQSLNFLAGLLLLFVETEEQCFWLLNVITRIYLPGTHETSLEGSKVDLGVLMTELRDTMPAVWDKIGGELEGSDPNFRNKSSLRPKQRGRKKDQPGLSTERLPPITLCMTAWFMSCYIGTLPIETTLRVWDVFFYEGSKTLFRVALSIFKLGESEIRAVSDPMEMFGVVQSMPRRMLDANGLMEACFKRRNGFSHLSQDAIEEKRQERRDQTQLDREQTENGGRPATSGAGASSHGEISRRATLFGKKKREPSKTRQAES